MEDGHPARTTDSYVQAPAEAETHLSFMRMAIDLARHAAALGEAPIGAVVVKDGEVVGAGHNWRETWRDPTAHAELVAIREASRRLGGWRLEGCDLYVTLEPCPMCAGAIVLARIRHVFFGAVDAKGGAVVSRARMLEAGLWNHQPNVTGGILGDECGMILKDFFRGIRSKTSRRDV